ncbi:MAG: hypothetical protein LBN95_04905 [Prevotellaceae bacterium]|nr:hypothetical protein [Prevotellaceae bacterium]
MLNVEFQNIIKIVRCKSTIKIKFSCHCGLDPQSFEKHLRAIAGQARNDTCF